MNSIHCSEMIECENTTLSYWWDILKIGVGKSKCVKIWLKQSSYSQVCLYLGIQYG